MKQRNIWGMLLLDFVTLGIYQLFWSKWTRDELVARGQKIPRFIWLLIPYVAMAALGVLGVVVLIANSDVNSAGEYEINDDQGAAAGVAAIFGIFLTAMVMLAVYIWWFYHYSKAVESVTNGRTSFDLAFGLWLVLHFFGAGFVWPMIMQDSFNKVGAEGSAPAVAEPAAGKIPDTPYPKIEKSQE